MANKSKDMDCTVEYLRVAHLQVLPHGEDDFIHQAAAGRLAEDSSKREI
jgi:hypothetical protein